MTNTVAEFDKDVFPAELQEIAARRAVLGRPAPPSEGGPHADQGLVGLALSGGGIRSATFSLGAIQALAQGGAFKAFDYLSTVSGGGFIGGFVSSLMNDPGVGSDGESFPLRAVTGAVEAPAVRHVRNSANYLAPGGLLDQIRIPALFLRGVLMNALAVVPYVMLAAILTQLYYSAGLDTWMTGAIVAAAVFLFVVLLLLTKLVNRWSSWTARNRYEGLLATSFLLLLILLLWPWLVSLVDRAKDLPQGSLIWQLQSLLTWRVLAAAVAVAVIAGAAQFSRTTARLRSVLALYAVGLLGPIVVFVGYLLMCVAYLEPKWLDTTAAELSPQGRQELDELGTLPDELTDKHPQGLDEAVCTPREAPVPEAYGPDGFAFWQSRQVRAWTSCGAYYLEFPDPKSVWFEADRVQTKPEELPGIVAVLDKERIPPQLYYELFQDGPSWYYFEAGTRVRVRTPGLEWEVRWPGVGDKYYVVVITLLDGWLYMFWEEPRGSEEQATVSPVPPFGRLAHIHKEEGASRLTSAGRRFTLRELHGRMAVSWDLGWDLNRGIVGDPLRKAFADKGGLPESAEVKSAGSPGSARWMVQPRRPAATAAPAAGTAGPPAEAHAEGEPVAGNEAGEPPVEIRGEDEGYWTPKRPPLFHRDIDVALVFLALVWLVFYNGLFLNVNASAFHGFYRDRLSRAYLVKSTGADSPGFVSNDRQRLSELNQPGTCAPYHLINVALNLNGMTEPDMRGRQCDFFVFSKHFTGSPRTGYCRTAELEHLHRHMNLGTAMAISGAAASPNAGTATLKPLVFLLTLLNVRLGYWLPHPARVSAKWWSPARLRLLLGVGSLYLWREAVGGVSSRAPYVNLSDGGHIENLGIYPLLRRRCRVIVAIDGEQDPQLRFASLMQLMMFARIDLGANIYIDLDQVRPSADDDGGSSRSHFAVGRIQYGGGEEGWLLYVKASMTGDEGPLLHDYLESNPDFPHQSTANQFFNERQFEMYRALGYHIVEGVLEQLKGPGEKGVDPRARREILEALHIGAGAGAV